MNWRALLRDEALPAAIVDLDAVDANLALVLEKSRLPVRLATKSVRVPWLVRYLLDRGLRGIMAYSLEETVGLVSLGFDDVLVAYPLAHPGEVRRLGELLGTGARVMPVIDCPEHVELLRPLRARVCIDVDVSLQVAGQHLGVMRSPVRDVAIARALARRAVDAGLVVDGVMAYEAQVAGVSDGSGVRRAAIGWMKARSVALAARRRAEVVAALRADGHPVSVVNGGGSGSLTSTPADVTVTEVTAGSAFLVGHLFDGYRDLPFRPAGFLALRVVRRPDAEHVTCFGGGIVASGATGPDRSPVVVAPPGLEPLSFEGWGEVQTPFHVPAGCAIDVGDPVICRPAKSGEWLERFPRVLCVRGDTIVERAPTYRGLGWAS